MLAFQLKTRRVHANTTDIQFEQHERIKNECTVKKMHSTHCLPFQVILKVVRNNETHFHLAFVRWHEIVHIICMRFFPLSSLLFVVFAFVRWNCAVYINHWKRIFFALFFCLHRSSLNRSDGCSLRRTILIKRLIEIADFSWLSYVKWIM